MNVLVSNVKTRTLKAVIEQDLIYDHRRMSTHYEVRWDSFGAHNAHSYGYIQTPDIGDFETREAAEVAKALIEKDFAESAKNQPMADTNLCVVKIMTDKRGNREEQSFT